MQETFISIVLILCINKIFFREPLDELPAFQTFFPEHFNYNCIFSLTIFVHRLFAILPASLSPGPSELKEEFCNIQYCRVRKYERHQLASHID